MSERPEGWYIDPADPRGHRYWDGQAWTPFEPASRPPPATLVAAPVDNARDRVEFRPSAPGRMPACEVLVDDVWVAGRVRGWYRFPDGWSAAVEYSAAVDRAGTAYVALCMSTFSAGEVRRTRVPADHELVGAERG